MIDYDIILDRAKALLEAIENNQRELWEPHLESAHNAVLLNDSKVRMDYDTTFEYNGISKEIDALKKSIKETEKAIYDSEPKNHPIWKALGVDPENNRGIQPDIEYVEGDISDPDDGYEIWRTDKYIDGLWFYIKIPHTTDSGRDWLSPEVLDYKSYDDTIKWLTERGAFDNDANLSEEYIIKEALDFREMHPFMDGYIINEEECGERF